MKELIKEAMDKGFVVAPEALETLKKTDDVKGVWNKVVEYAEKNGIFFIDRTLVEKFSKKEVIIKRRGFRPEAKEVSEDIKIFKKESLSALSGPEGFIKYFRRRYEKFLPFFKGRGNGDYTPIEALKRRKSRDIKIVGMVVEKRKTKSGNFRITVDDPTGEVDVIVSKDSPAYDKAGEIVEDEVIACIGRYRSFFIANDILFPDIPKKPLVKTEEDIAIAFLSDLHIGSKLFLEKPFKRFLEWIKGDVGDSKQKELAGKIKYISICGDIVDGIGIYPGQENELEIVDIFEQYDAFTKLMEEIPDYIHVIVAPGNHDAVRNADPQPPLPKTLLPDLYQYSNFHFIPSPGYVEIHGMKMLAYHGTSFDGMISRIENASYESIDRLMEIVLRKRHVHPNYGEKPIIPTKEEELIIDPVPDIFHCGHVHTNAYTIYHGVYAINSGTWQDITPYQIKQGHKPTPARLPILLTKNGKIKVMHFGKVENC